MHSSPLRKPYRFLSDTILKKADDVPPAASEAYLDNKMDSEYADCDQQTAGQF